MNKMTQSSIGILFSEEKEKEGTTDICNYMDEFQKLTKLGVHG